MVGVDVACSLARMQTPLVDQHLLSVGNAPIHEHPAEAA